MNSKFSGLRLAASFLALAVTTLPLFAQATSGNLTGTIYDPSGAAIADATVAATNGATGVVTATHTTSTGDYRFENLPVGSYSMAVSAAGFSKAQVNNVNIQLNKRSQPT
jgi:hypothetical protein